MKKKLTNLLLHHVNVSFVINFIEYRLSKILFHRNGFKTLMQIVHIFKDANLEVDLSDNLSVPIPISLNHKAYIGHLNKYLFILES